jgi:hypothetical protein
MSHVTMESPQGAGDIPKSVWGWGPLGDVSRWGDRATAPFQNIWIGGFPGCVAEAASVLLAGPHCWQPKPGLIVGDRQALVEQIRRAGHRRAGGVQCGACRTLRALILIAAVGLFFHPKSLAGECVLQSVEQHHLYRHLHCLRHLGNKVSNDGSVRTDHRLSRLFLVGNTEHLSVCLRCTR